MSKLIRHQAWEFKRMFQQKTSSGDPLRPLAPEGGDYERF
jgi:hypothetical protein